MKRGTLILSIAGLLLVGGILWAVSAKPSMTDTPSAPQPNPVETTTDVTTNMSSAQPGQYIDYNEANLAELPQINVLFFHASWCPTCKMLDKNLKNSTIPENLIIHKVDYDTSQELQQKYGVTYQHTLVQVDANGNEIKQWSGSYTIEDIKEQLQ